MDSSSAPKTYLKTDIPLTDWFQVDGMEPSLIAFPYMRLEVLEALKALADTQRQREQWGKYDSQSASYGDLNMWLAALEDGGVLPDPSKAVGLTIHPTELPHFRASCSAQGRCLIWTP
jgi:hypothetical protein